METREVQQSKALSPMEALQLLAWLQEYRERLAAAACPRVQPSVGDAQAAPS